MSTTPPEPDQPGSRTDQPGSQPGPQPGPQWGPPPSGGPPTSTLAVVGLVLAFVAAPVGVVVSVLGLRETRGGARGGRGLAVAGTVIGSVITVVALVTAVLLGVFAVSATRAALGSVTATAPPVPSAPALPELPGDSPTGAPTDTPTDVPTSGDGGPETTDDITIVDCSADPATSSFSGVLSITNSADVPASYAITFNGYTEDRQLTAWATGEVTDLAPGATTEVTVTGATFDTTTPVSICRLEGTFRSTDSAG